MKHISSYEDNIKMNIQEMSYWLNLSDTGHLWEPVPSKYVNKILGSTKGAEILHWLLCS
jgi:hypothetical protein